MSRLEYKVSEGKRDKKNAQDNGGEVQLLLYASSCREECSFASPERRPQGRPSLLQEYGCYEKNCDANLEV